MKKTTLALGMLLASGAAFAGSPQVFHWSASDLATDEALAETHTRIKATAHRYCRQQLRGVRSLRQSTQCVAAVTDEIVLSINDQRLIAFAGKQAADELMAAR